jgi:hypothetical protein
LDRGRWRKRVLIMVADADVDLLHHPIMIAQFLPHVHLTVQAVTGIQLLSFVVHCLDQVAGYLGVIRTWSSIRHAQQERLLVQHLEVLVVKLLSVDALAARTICSREVTRSQLALVTRCSRSCLPALDHEAFDDAVEARALVVQRLVRLGHALLARA